jgi:hypothetical protein
MEGWSIERKEYQQGPFHHSSTPLLQKTINMIDIEGYR